jgi:cholest-4-en-3-one 26-monooxygenase
VLHFKRTTTADTEIRGTEIKEGDQVVMWYISANRDEDVFDDPYTFDVTRDPNPQIAFGGGGNHFCLGANLARMELRLIFEEITKRMPDMQLASEPDRLRSNFIGGIKHMNVTYTPGKRVLPANTSL